MSSAVEPRERLFDDVGSNDLLPFEWCVYAGRSLRGRVGAYVDRLLQRPTSRIPHAP